MSGAFHPSTVNRNSNRQKRILANAASVTAPGGYLAYMTCTFAKEENEQVIEWLLKRDSSFSLVEVSSLEQYQSPYSPLHCYRFWPFDTVGAGGFAALLRREGTIQEEEGSFHNLPCVWQQEAKDSS